MAKILSLQDAMDYLRLCDGDEDYDSSVYMVVGAYKEIKEMYSALRATFATEVENSFNGELLRKDTEIAHLKKQVTTHEWRLARVRDASYADPEDENDE